MNRGDVVLVRFPHPSGVRGKKRPAVRVQSDSYAGVVGTLVVAEVVVWFSPANDNDLHDLVLGAGAAGVTVGKEARFTFAIEGSKLTTARE